MMFPKQVISSCFSTMRFFLTGSLLALMMAGSPASAATYASQTDFSQTDGSTEPATTAPPSTCSQAQSTAAYSELALVSSLTQTATWMEQPAIGMSTLVANLAPQLLAYLNPSPFPEINPRARQAKVPVMMYHDILPEKQVFFDVTPEEFEQHLEQIRKNGLTPITMDQLVNHLRTGLPLPEKPILLTFDDGYSGHYEYVYPLLKKYNYPAVFSIYTSKVGKKLGRSSLTWEQLREMAKDPLVTIASHSISHKIMSGMSDVEVQYETQESKRILEAELSIPIRYFTYPEGKFDDKAKTAVQTAGYSAALTMDDLDERLAGQSENLLAIGRIGQSRLEEMLQVAWGGTKLPALHLGFDFSAPIQHVDMTIDNTPFTFISGGKPITIHAKSRYQVPQIIAGTQAIAAVDGGFFSLEFLDSNIMIGPVYSQSHGRFIPNKVGENHKIARRPLVLISPSAIKFVPYDPTQHNTLEGIQTELPQVTDAFLAAAWLVKEGQPQPAASFGKLFDFDAERHRAFWGVNQQGQPVIGVSKEPIGSVALGEALTKAGFRDAVMLDSGASTSLAYKGESLVGYEPRPVPHVVALVPSSPELESTCTLVSTR